MLGPLLWWAKDCPNSSWFCVCGQEVPPGHLLLLPASGGPPRAPGLCGVQAESACANLLCRCPGLPPPAGWEPGQAGALLPFSLPAPKAGFPGRVLGVGGLLPPQKCKSPKQRRQGARGSHALLRRDKRLVWPLLPSLSSGRHPGGEPSQTLLAPT